MKNIQNKNVAHLNSYSNEKTLDSIRQQKRNKFVRIRTICIALAGAFLIAIASRPLLHNLRVIDEYHAIHDETVKDLEALENERKNLEYQVGLLEDEEYIAKLARQELNVSKSNEILINIPEKEETPSNPEDEEENSNKNN